jgi:hypothetical protein
MIERVSTMIMELDGGRDWRHYTENAYAIIRDMRAPTPQMRFAAEGKMGEEPWKAMIDEILAEKI